MVHEQFHLSRNDFHVTATGTFKTLIDDKNFVDVTLVCEDDKQLTAHKVILSANSIFFKNILTNNHHQHPLIYLSGIKFCDLQSLVKFMYLGEVSIQEKDLKAFLFASEMLKIEGLSSYFKMFTSVSQNNSVIEAENSVEETTNKETFPAKLIQAEQIDGALIDKDIESKQYPSKLNLPNFEYEEMEGLEKEDPVQEIEKVFKFELGSDGKYPCGQCDHRATSITSLYIHKQSSHDQVTYSCDLCQYEATTTDILNNHKRSHFDTQPLETQQTIKEKENISDNFYFECYQCDFISYDQRGLHLHIAKSHKPIKTEGKGTPITDENHTIVKYKLYGSLREFRLIDLSHSAFDQIEGIHAEDDIVLMISGEGMEESKIGHFDCFSWRKSSKGSGKKSNIGSNNCIEYNSKGCPATKRRWICAGKCEFEDRFCCEYFKGEDTFFCLYAFKHSHEPPKVDTSYGY